MAGLHTELLRTLESLEFRSPSAFRLFGRDFTVEEDVNSPAPDSVLSSPAHARLEGVLYAVLHCREPLDPPLSAAFDDWLGAREFAARLSRANSGSGSWQSGWIVRGVEGDGRLVVEKYRVRFWVHPEACRVDELPVAAGGAAWVRLPKEWRQLAPGFYLALGNADDDLDTVGATRLYWHITPRIAEAFTRRLTSEMNEGGIPFRFKLLADPQSYYRADAAVLYVRAGSYGRVAPLVQRLYREFEEGLKPQVSAFVKRLAPGLGVAEDPGLDTSFGQHRCQVLAATLASPIVAAASSASERLERTLASLRVAGLDPDAMFLHNGSDEAYQPFA